MQAQPSRKLDKLPHHASLCNQWAISLRTIDHREEEWEREEGEGEFGTMSRGEKRDELTTTAAVAWSMALINRAANGFLFQLFAKSFASRLLACLHSFPERTPLLYGRPLTHPRSYDRRPCRKVSLRPPIE